MLSPLPRSRSCAQEASCPQLLRMGLEVDLETLDGAIQAKASGEAAQWLPGVGENAESRSPTPIGHAYADLRDVTGSLKLHPSEPEDDGIPLTQMGQLSVVLRFEGDQTRGSLWPTIWFQGDNREAIVRHPDYVPVLASWPTREPASHADAGVAGLESTTAGSQ